MLHFLIDCKRKIFPKDEKFLKNVIIVCKQIQFDMPNMTCFLFSHARDLHAKFKARPGKNTGPKRCPFCSFCPISPRKSPINFVPQIVLLSIVNMKRLKCEHCPIPGWVQILIKISKSFSSGTRVNRVRTQVLASICKVTKY